MSSLYQKYPFVQSDLSGLFGNLALAGSGGGSATPSGLAGGDLFGYYPNPYVKELTGQGVSWRSLSPKYIASEGGGDIVPTAQPSFIGWKNSSVGIMCSNYGALWMTTDGGATWKTLYTLSLGTARDIAYGQISPGVNGWLIVGDNATYFPDIAGNYTAGVPNQSAWVVKSISWAGGSISSIADVIYHVPSASWMIAGLTPGVGVCYDITVSSWTRYIPSGNTNNVGGLFTDSNTGRVVLFERGTGGVFHALDPAGTWTQVTKGGVPIIKYLFPSMSDSNGIGTANSQGGISVFAGTIGAVSTTDILDPEKYGIAFNGSGLPALWDIAVDGQRWMATSVNTTPWLFQLFIGSIPAHRDFVAEKNLIALQDVVIDKLPNCDFLTTNTFGEVERGYHLSSGLRVENFGISSSNSPAENTAILLELLKSSVDLVFGPHIYHFDPFTFPETNNVTMKGFGPNNSIINLTGNSGIKFNSSYYKNILIRDLSLQCLSSVQDPNAGGIIEKGSPSLIDGLSFINCKFSTPYNCQNGVKFVMNNSSSDKISNISFYECEFFEISRMGIEFNGSGTLYRVSNVTIEKCYFHKIGVQQYPSPYATSIACSIVCSLQSSVGVYDCIFREILPNIGGNTGGAIELGKNTIVSRCVFEQDTGDIYSPVGCYGVEDPYNSMVVNCIEGKNSFYEFVYSDWKFYDCKNVSLIGNVIRGTVVLRDVTLLRISNNYIALQVRMENSPSSSIITENRMGLIGYDYPIWSKVPGCVISCSNNSFYGDNSTFLKDPLNCTLYATKNFHNGVYIP